MFSTAWPEFAAWAGGMIGPGVPLLVRDTGARERFVSFAVWDSLEAVRAWQSAPELCGRLARPAAGRRFRLGRAHGGRRRWDRR